MRNYICNYFISKINGFESNKKYVVEIHILIAQQFQTHIQKDTFRIRKSLTLSLTKVEMLVIFIS